MNQGSGAYRIYKAESGLFGFVGFRATKQNPRDSKCILVAHIAGSAETTAVGAPQLQRLLQ